MNNDKVICAAMLMDDGMIVSGVRHFSPDMRLTLERIYGRGIPIWSRLDGARIWLKKPYWHRVKDHGFIDRRGQFLTRKEAFARVLLTKQCPHLDGVPAGSSAELFSEDLY